MIPHRIWLVEIGGEEKKFCNPECEQLYVEYWLPTHTVKSNTWIAAHILDHEEAKLEAKALEEKSRFTFPVLWLKGWKKFIKTLFVIII